MFKKLSLSLMVVALVAMLVSGATFALFTASTANQGNTYTTGTVTLGTPSTTLIPITNMAPGDTAQATYTVQYTGSLKAFLGLDASVSGDLFSGSTPLRLTITNAANGTLFDSNINPSVANVQINGEWNTGESTNLTITYDMPLGAGNEYQYKGGSLSLMVHAVQSKNNTNSATPAGPISWN